MPSLEEKQAERSRLEKAYRARKRQQWLELCEREPRIKDFEKAVRQCMKPSAVLALIRGSWLMEASDDTRFYALKIISKHCDRMALREGRQILDDPLPPATSLFFVCKELLRVR